MLMIQWSEEQRSVAEHVIVMDTAVDTLVSAVRRGGDVNMFIKLDPSSVLLEEKEENRY